VSLVVNLPFKKGHKVDSWPMVMDIVGAMSREPEFINTWVHEKQAPHRLPDPAVCIPGAFQLIFQPLPSRGFT